MILDPFWPNGVIAIVVVAALIAIFVWRALKDL